MLNVHLSATQYSIITCQAPAGSSLSSGRRCLGGEQSHHISAPRGAWDAWLPTRRVLGCFLTPPASVVCNSSTAAGPEETTDGGVQALRHIRQTPHPREQASPQRCHVARRGRARPRHGEFLGFNKRVLLVSLCPMLSSFILNY